MSVFIPMGVIGFAYKYVIAEKFSMFSCIGYQRFFIRQFQFQFVCHKLLYVLFDFDTILFAANNTNEKIIRISHIFQTFHVRIHFITCWIFQTFFDNFSNLFQQQSPFRFILCLFQLCCQVVFFLPKLFCYRIFFAPFSLIEFLSVFFDVFVELVKIDICQYRTYYPTLWCSAIRFVKYPIFHISGIQKLSDKAQKTHI